MNHQLIKFLVRACILGLLWQFFFKELRYSSGINEFYESATVKLTNAFLYTSGLTLKIWGYNIEIIGKVVRIAGTGGVLLDKGCLGRNLMALFVGFIMMVPGVIKHKIWFIPAGLFTIFCLNVTRINILVILCASHPSWIPLNHDVIFPRIVQGLIFLEWVVYFQWFRKPRARAQSGSK